MVASGVLQRPDPAGIPRETFRELRCAAATLALMGLHPNGASDMLRHNTACPSIENESHLLSTMHEQPAVAMDAILAV